MEELLKLNEIKEDLKRRDKEKLTPTETKYKPSHIIRRFMWQRFLKIPDKNVIGIIINIKNTKEDLKILNRWESHFQGYFCGIKIDKGSPYIITENPKSKTKTLWKERIV